MKRHKQTTRFGKTESRFFNRCFINAIAQTTHRQRQCAVAHCREPRLFSQSLPRRKSLLSVRAGAKTPTTVSQDCLLGVGVLCTQVEYSKFSFCHCEEQRGLRRGNLAERNAPDGWIPTLTLGMTIAQTTPRQRQHASAHCREPRLFSQSLPRRESLLSVQAGTKILPQFRKIVCLVLACFARKRINECLFRAFLYTECAYSKCEPQRRREYECRA